MQGRALSQPSWPPPFVADSSVTIQPGHTLWSPRPVPHLEPRCEPAPFAGRVFFWLGEKSQQILMIQAPAQVFEIRREGNGSFVSQKVSLTAGLRRDLRKIVLAPSNWPPHTTKVANAGREDRVDQDARFLGLLNGRVDIWVGRTNAAEAIDAIRDHQHLVAQGAFRPTLDNVGKRQIWASERANVTKRKEERLSSWESLSII